MPTNKPTELTPRQKQLVETIAALTAKRGYAPSLREVAAIMGIHFTRAGILAREAEIRGAITHAPRIARSWRVVETRGRL